MKIIPVINKIDLPSANVERAIEQMVMTLNFDEKDIIQISAKNGINVDKVFDAIITRIPPPKGNPDVPPKGFLFNAKHVETKGI